MRIVIVFVAAIVLAAPAGAQPGPYCYVEVELPAPGMIAVIHPTLPGDLYLSDGTPWGPCDVRVGESSYDPWGECMYEGPLPGVDAILIEAVPDVEGLALLDEPLALGSPPDTGGWTTVELAQLRGGGHTDGAVWLAGSVPEHFACLFGTRFELEIRSPDINGDLAVDLTDIVLFVQALAEYRSYADLRPDGIVNLSDIVVMAQGIFDR